MQEGVNYSSRRNLININSETKYNFNKNNKLFINKKLTRSNESILCFVIES